MSQKAKTTPAFHEQEPLSLPPRLISTPSERLVEKITGACHASSPSTNGESRTAGGIFGAGCTPDIIASVEMAEPDEPHPIDRENKIQAVTYPAAGRKHPGSSRGHRSVVEWIDGPGIEHGDEQGRDIDHAPSGQVVAVAETADEAEAEIEAEMRERLRSALGGTIPATPVKDDESTVSKTIPNKKHQCLLAALLLAVVGVVTALVVAFAPSGEESRDVTEATVVYEGLESSAALHASLEYTNTGSYGFSAYADARRHRPKGSREPISEGLFGDVLCNALPCDRDGSKCHPSRVYKPGCCLGPNCEPAEQCGMQCPPLPESCYHNTTFTGCRTAECYTCNKGPDGEDLWSLHDSITEVDCLATGTAMNGDHEYKWAIMCGPVKEDYRWEDDVYNMTQGEYMCRAFRKGGQLYAEDVGLKAFSIPCQYVQLGECGCAPDDIHPWNLDPPTAPCEPDDCPFLCSDAGKEHASKLCHAFSGIKWWEGDNFMTFNMFEPEGNPVVFDLVINQEFSEAQESVNDPLWNLLLVAFIVLAWAHDHL